MSSGTSNGERSTTCISSHIISMDRSIIQKRLTPSTSNGARGVTTTSGFTRNGGNGVIDMKWDDDSENSSSCGSTSAKSHMNNSSNNNSSNNNNNSNNEVLAMQQQQQQKQQQKEQKIHSLHQRLLRSNDLLMRKESSHTVPSTTSGCCSIEESTMDEEDEEEDYSEREKENKTKSVNPSEEQQQTTAADQPKSSSSNKDAITSNTLKLLGAVEALNERRRRVGGCSSVIETTTNTHSPQEDGVTSTTKRSSVVLSTAETMEVRLMDSLLRSKTQASSMAPSSVAIGGEFKLGYETTPQMLSTSSESVPAEATMTNEGGRSSAMEGCTTGTTEWSVGGSSTGSPPRRPTKEQQSMEIAFNGETGTFDENGVFDSPIKNPRTNDPVQRAFEHLKSRADRLERVRQRVVEAPPLFTSVTRTTSSGSDARSYSRNDEFPHDEAPQTGNVLITTGGKKDANFQSKDDDEGTQGWVEFPSVFGGSSENLKPEQSMETPVSERRNSAITGKPAIGPKEFPEVTAVSTQSSLVTDEQKVFTPSNNRTTSTRTFKQEEISFAPQVAMDNRAPSMHTTSTSATATVDQDPYAVTFATKSVRRFSSGYGSNNSFRNFSNGIPSVIYEPTTPYDDDTSTCISSVVSNCQRLQRSSLHESEHSTEFVRSPVNRSPSKKKAFVVPQVHTLMVNVASIDLNNDNNNNNANNDQSPKNKNEITFVPSFDETDEFNADERDIEIDEGNDEIEDPYKQQRRRSDRLIRGVSGVGNYCFTVDEQDEEMICDSFLQQNEKATTTVSRLSGTSNSLEICFIPFPTHDNRGPNDDNNTREEKSTTATKELSDSSSSTLSRSRHILNQSCEV